MVGNGSGQVECSDLKIKQPLGAKPEVRNQFKTAHTTTAKDGQFNEKTYSGSIYDVSLSD